MMEVSGPQGKRAGDVAGPAGRQGSACVQRGWFQQGGTGGQGLGAKRTWLFNPQESDSAGVGFVP